MLSLTRLRGLGGCRTALQRRHQSSFGQNLSGDSSGKQKLVIFGICGVNLAVFGAWQVSERDTSLRAYMQQNFTVSSQGVFQQGKYHTLITAFFSQKDASHLLFNGMAFVSFGMNSIALLGSSRFLLLYMGGGLLSSIAQVSWPYMIPRSWPAYHHYSPYSAGLGASGAVNAVVAWNIITFPTSLIYLYGLLPLPAALLGLAFLGADAYSLYFGQSNIGNAAHLAGSAYGTAFWVMMRRGALRRP